ncbi:MAG TPA: 3-hydroxyacyl-CoA dehydrogenase family protein, partial [Actinotalea sp.]|nr:3-hydroxyacyl-CoA dehydrogenase family protein [Actinotalea sp.]
TVLAVAGAAGRTSVLVADRPGFVVNRILLRELGEVLGAVESGTPVEVADAALDPLGLPMGPFALLQLVGLPVVRHVLESLREDLGPRYPRSPGLAALADAGRQVVLADGAGARAGSVDPGVQDAFGVAGGPGALDGPGVLDAVLTGLADEVGRMLDERVVAAPDQIDLCLILGAGFPFHLGGLLPHLDRTGYSERVTGRRFLVGCPRTRSRSSSSGSVVSSNR